MLKFFYSIVLFLTILYFPTRAQNISGVINNYAKITAFDTCNVSIKVTDVTGFYKGLNVIIMQMNGAYITGSNDQRFGNLETLANSGYYETNTIDSVGTKEIFLSRRFLNQYDSSAANQVISFPFYTDATVTDTLKAKPWDGNTGGVLALDATTITLLSNISATGAGFRGGSVASYSDCTGGSNYGDYFYPINAGSLDNGGVKGEGVAQVIAGRECGRGPQLNGGGGGNNHKSGGGGGANFGNGGGGGETNYHGSLFFPCRGKNPGWGGIGITTVGAQRIYLGGGGGSGHNKEKSSSNGGNGGGIIILRSVNFNGNASKITANGADAPTCTGDGGGGGGGGGTILFYTTNYNSPATLEAKGGTGGATITGNGYDFGPGGGGGGGRILSTNNAVTKNVTAGVYGVNNNSKSNQNASSGIVGVANVAAFTLPTSTKIVDRNFVITKQPTATLVCTGRKTALTISATGNKLVYKWQLNKNDGKGYADMTNDSIYSNVDSATLQLKNLKTDYNPYLYRCIISSGCNNSRQIVSDPTSLNIKPSPVAIFTSAINYNSVTFVNGSSNALSYSWQFGDGQNSTQPNVSHIFSKQGTFSVVLTAYNECDTVVYKKDITLNTPPKAGFSSNTVDYCAPASVQFFNNSSNNASDFLWQFPGGTPATSTEVNPTIVFNSSGVFDVSLIAKNQSGADTINKTAYVRVNSKPKAKFTFKNNGTTFGFENKSDGGTGFQWNFGDGKTSTETNPQHAYTNSGNYIVKFIVTNPCGVDSFQDTVLLLTIPTAIVSANTTNGCSPLIVQFNAQNSSDTKTWDWSFPGGTPSSSNLPSPKIIYNAIGVYDVNLTVSSASGANTTKLEKFIQVYDAPLANFDMVIQKNVVTFKNKSANANLFMWDFGDGTTSTETDPPPHVYAHNGTYSVTLQTLNTYCGAATGKFVDITFFVPTVEADSSDILSLYPNPNSGSFTIRTSLQSFKLLNSSGQVALYRELRKDKACLVSYQNYTDKACLVSTFDIDATDLPDGLYAVCLTDGNKIWVRKMIIQR